VSVHSVQDGPPRQSPELAEERLFERLEEPFKELSELPQFLRRLERHDGIAPGIKLRERRKARRRLQRAALEVELAVEAMLAPYEGLRAPPSVVLREVFFRRYVNAASDWISVAAVRRKSASPNTYPLLICRGLEIHFPGHPIHGRDGCGLVYRGQWRIGHRGVAAAGPRCPGCHDSKAATLAVTAPARDASFRSGVLRYIAADGEPVWIGVCRTCGIERVQRSRWQDRCASCRQR
jgi:hypothetical protein